MTGNRVAYRYANALFMLSGEQKATENVYQDLLLIASTLDLHSEISAVLENPVLEESKKLTLINELFSSHVTKMVNDFITFLGSKGRLIVLIDICKEFIEIYKKSIGVIAAEVHSAVPLDDTQEKNITELLSAQTGKKVILSKSVDSTLVGGFAIRLEDQYYDNTLRNKLRKLSKTLINEK